MTASIVVNHDQAIEVITSIALQNLEYAKSGAKEEPVNVYLVGEPGIGKTTCTSQAAANINLPYPDPVVIAQYDAGEFAGIHFLVGKDMIRTKPHWMPTEACLLCFDELPQAPLANLNLFAQVAQERRIGEHFLPAGTTIVATGNESKHKAGVGTIPSHVRDRMLFLFLVLDPQGWLRHAASKLIDPLITSYHQWKNCEYLQKFDPSADVSATARSWFKANEVLKLRLSPHAEYAALAGTVGPGAATDFHGYVKLARSLEDPDWIIANPTAAKVHEEPSELYATIAALASRAEPKTFKGIMTYLERIEAKEYSAYALRDMVGRNPKLRTTSEFTKWAINNADLLVA